MTDGKIESAKAEIEDLFEEVREVSPKTLVANLRITVPTAGSPTAATSNHTSEVGPNTESRSVQAVSKNDHSCSSRYCPI